MKNYILFYNTAVETVLTEEHQFQGRPLKICRCAEKQATYKDDVSFNFCCRRAILFNNSAGHFVHFACVRLIT